MSRLPHILGDQLTDGSEAFSLKHQMPFTPGKFLPLISVESAGFVLNLRILIFKKSKGRNEMQHVQSWPAEAQKMFHNTIL
jgi:hypothetical protein